MTPIAAEPEQPQDTDKTGHDAGHDNTVQVVRAANGFAYGAVDADVHVFGDGMPLYLLENWRPPPQPDAEFLRVLPSRMLNARFAVVAFTGRQRELADLHRWRQDGPRLAARWLHAPGGTGKTRLVNQFARETHAAGWKVVTATHGPGTVMPPPGSQDLRLTGAAGLLLIIDYADRWPLTHLTWLFSNALLHQSAIRTRVLLLARSADAWPAVRATLTNQQADTSTQFLAPLPDSRDGASERLEMFVAARDGFAARYADDTHQAGDTNRAGASSGFAASDIGPPGSLADPDFGLTLAVHMAALVAVDAHVTGRRAPSDMAGLTIYLLDREHLHWERRYGEAGHELDPAERSYRTPPGVMNQAVFTAALTGPLTRPAGLRVLAALDIPQLAEQCLPTPAEQVIADHATCYPPAVPGQHTVLEPLYPDRLAEDLLALTLPEHTADYPAQPWAAPTSATLLQRDSEHATPVWLPRAVTFLASAAERWPHLGPCHLYPLLRADPRLALAAGSAALTALAALDDIEPALLEAIESCFPPPGSPHVDLDIGIAAIADRVARHRLARADDIAEHAAIHHDLSIRLSAAGRREAALAASQQAVTLYRGLDTTRRSASERVVIEANLPLFLRSLGLRLAHLGQWDKALDAAREAVAILRPLAERQPETHELTLAKALGDLGEYLAMGPGQWGAATAAVTESTAIIRRLAAATPAAFDDDLAAGLGGLGRCQAHAGQLDQAVDTALEAVTILRRLAARDPAVHEPHLALALSNLSGDLSRTGRATDSLALAEEAVEVARRLVAANPSAYEPTLAAALTGLGPRQLVARDDAAASASIEEAVSLLRRLATTNPATYEPTLAEQLMSRGLSLFVAGRPADAVASVEEAVAISRRLVDGDRPANAPQLAMSLSALAGLRAETRTGLTAALREIIEAATIDRQVVAAAPQDALVGLTDAIRSTAARVAEVLAELDRGREATELRALLSDDER